MVKEGTKKFIKWIDKYYSNHYVIFGILFVIVLMTLVSFYVLDKFALWGLFLTTLLLVLHIVFIIIHAIARSVKSLIREELTLTEILGHYLYGTLALIGLFALLYFMFTALGWGALECTAKTCSAGVWKYIYFSSTTYFTIGYGDIVPTGMNQAVAIASALAWNAFTVIIMAVSLHKIEDRTK